MFIIRAMPEKGGGGRARNKSGRGEGGGGARGFRGRGDTFFCYREGEPVDNVPALEL